MLKWRRDKRNESQAYQSINTNYFLKSRFSLSRSKTIITEKDKRINRARRFITYFGNGKENFYNGQLYEEERVMFRDFPNLILSYKCFWWTSVYIIRPVIHLFCA